MIFKFFSFRVLLTRSSLYLIQAILSLQPIKGDTSEITAYKPHIEVLDKAIDQIYQMSLSGNIYKENLQELYQKWKSIRMDLNDSYESSCVYAEYGERITALALDNKPELIPKFAAQILEGTIDTGILLLFINEFAKRSGYENVGVECHDYRSKVHVLHTSHTKAFVICINYGIYNESADFLVLERIGNIYKLSKYAPPGEEYGCLHMYNISVEANKNEFKISPRPVTYVQGDMEVWKITPENAYLINLNPIYGYLPIDKDVEKLTPIERLIYDVDCITPTHILRRLDRMLNFVYKQAYIINPKKNLLKKHQRSWLKARPNTTEALKKVYEKRIWELLDNDALLSSLCDAILSGLFQDGDYFYDETRGYEDYVGERLGVIAHALYKKHYGNDGLPNFDFDAYHYSSMVKASDNKVFIFWATKSAIREGNIALYFVCMALERKAKGVFSIKLVPFPGQPSIANIKPDGSTLGGYWGGLKAYDESLVLKKRQSSLWPTVIEKWQFDKEKQKWIGQDYKT